MQETWVWSLDWKDSPGEGNGNPLQYSFLGNPTTGRAAWRAIVHGVTRVGHNLVAKALFLNIWTIFRNTQQVLKQLRKDGGESQDGRGIGQGDHFLPYKFIERTFERWANFTKKLLTASRRHQAPRKAAHHLRKEVGQNIKDKKRDKRVRDKKGVIIEEVSKHQTLSLVGLGEVFESRRAT